MCSRAIIYNALKSPFSWLLLVAINGAWTRGDFFASEQKRRGGASEILKIAVFVDKKYDEFDLQITCIGNGHKNDLLLWISIQVIPQPKLAILSWFPN